MIVRLANIFVLYTRNRLFVVLFVTLILSAGLSKLLIIKGAYASAEEMWNIMFVTMLWVIFYLGVLIKQQIANHRAALLPGYRFPHIVVMTIFSLALLLIGIFWNYGIIWEYHLTTSGINGGYVCCVLMGLVILYLGYLSMGRVLLYAYGVAVIAALNVESLIRIFEVHPQLIYAVVGTSVLFFVAFVYRLLTLNADHFEYPVLFSWPPQVYMSRMVHASVEPRFLNLFPAKNVFSQLRRYADHPRLLSRVFHWDPALKRSIKITTVAVVITSPIYLIMLQQLPEVRDFFTRAYFNFMLLSLTPVLATLIGQYKKISYWEYDLLRPVTRDQYLKERGLLLGIHLMAHWLLVIWFIALVPAIVFQAQLLVTLKFWLYLSLTGLCALMVLAWLAALSCSNNSRFIIGNGIILGLVLIFFTYFTDQLGVRRMAVSNIFALAAVILLVRSAYYGWIRREGI